MIRYVKLVLEIDCVKFDNTLILNNAFCTWMKKEFKFKDSCGLKSIYQEVDKN